MSENQTTNGTDFIERFAKLETNVKWIMDEIIKLSKIQQEANKGLNMRVSALEERLNKISWVPALITAVITAVCIYFIKGMM